MQDALKVLFDLLEEYAPSWYTEEHHSRTLSALEASAERRRQQRVGGPRT